MLGLVSRTPLIALAARNAQAPIPPNLKHCPECGKVIGPHKGWFASAAGSQAMRFVARMVAAPEHVEGRARLSGGL